MVHQSKDAEFKPYLEKIDEIDASVTELERTVVLLDDYTKRLEKKFKHLKAAGRLPYQRKQTATAMTSEGV